MKSTVYCTPTDKGIHTFYLVIEGHEYYLFRQNYRKGVNEFFRDGVDLDRALDFTKSRHDEAVIRTMSKRPMYIKYIEKCYGVEVLRATAKRNNVMRGRRCCA